MLSNLDALTYKDQLHPAYAGYLHDGEITEQDVLATIFYLIKTGVIVPVFESNDLTKRIIALRITRKKPYYKFEQDICQCLFNSSQEVTSEKVFKIIKSEKIKHILLKNITSITFFPLINKQLRFFGKTGEIRFSVNDKPVTDIKTAKEFKNTLTWIILPIFTVVGFTMVIEPIIKGVNPTHTIFPAIFCVSLPWLIYFSFIKSKKIVSYDFQNDVIPFAKARYYELFEFLKSRPISNHNLTNEFISFSIAFGLDKSWNRDFGLESEINIDSARRSTV